METIKTDVLIIGSGFGAAAPALRLSKSGFKVLMIEKGKDIQPDKDFKQTSDPKYLLQYLKGISSETVSFSYAEALGGGSGFYEMVSLRAPSKVFEQVDSRGNRLWPDGVDRNALDPYYDIAESMLQVEQISTDELPKSGVVFSALMKNIGYSCDRARYAVKGCVVSGYCISGCIFGAKQSLHFNYLPQAKTAGMEIITGTEAVSIAAIQPSIEETKDIRLISNISYRYRVLCRVPKDGRKFVIFAKLIVLGGGTIGTAKLLLNSGEFLPLLSSHVGKNIAFNGSVKAAGLLPEGFIEGDMLSGRSHPGMISYHFFDSMQITVSSAKPLPLHLVSAARFCPDGDGSFWGNANAELMKQYRRKMIILYALGLTPPCAEISKAEDTFEAVLKLNKIVRNYYKQTKELLNSIFIRNGCKVIKTHPVNHEGKMYKYIHFDTTHMIGSCRMADKKECGVTDKFGEAFNYPGLYVTDGAAIPSSLAVNSSLTILANAERIAAGIVNKYYRENYQPND